MLKRTSCQNHFPHLFCTILMPPHHLKKVIPESKLLYWRFYNVSSITHSPHSVVRTNSPCSLPFLCILEPLVLDANLSTLTVIYMIIYYLVVTFIFSTNFATVSLFHSLMLSTNSTAVSLFLKFSFLVFN